MPPDLKLEQWVVYSQWSSCVFVSRISTAGNMCYFRLVSGHTFMVSALQEDQAIDL